MKSSILFLALLTICFLTPTQCANVSCRHVYRCSDDEVCWNGECVRKDPKAVARHHNNYQFIVAKKTVAECRTSRDCKGFGFGNVCSKGVCRNIRSV
uniref:Uncharacterized protein n=1 Tax=Caenorhabditis japonica TaxID=281687 RepID=A0A8R1EV61_CAEJA